MNARSTTTPGMTKIGTVALRQVGQERRRLLAARTAVGASYVPRHRADVPVDSAA